MTIKVLSYNVHALLSKLGHDPLSNTPPRFDKHLHPFSDLVALLKPHVILLQEINVIGTTLTDQNFPFHLFLDYVYFAENFRSAALISTTLNSSQLDISGGRKCHTQTYASCWVQINLPRHQPYVLCSLYRPGNCSMNEFRSFWDELADAQAISSFTFVCGDINAQHAMWGAPVSDRVGDAIATELLEYGLHAVPLPSPSWHSFSGDASSFIDITCSSCEGISRIVDWRYDFRYDVGSDHNPISFSLLRDEEEAKDSFKIWDIKDGDWKQFKCDLTTQLDHWCNSFDPTSDANALADSWTKVVYSTASQSLGTTTIKPGKTRLWWHKGLRQLIRDKNRLRKQSQRTRRPAHLLEYHRAKNRVEKAIADAKQTAWTKLIQQLNESDDKKFCSIYRRVCSDRRKIMPPLERSDKTICESSREKADLCLQTFRKAAMGKGTACHNKTVLDELDEIQRELSDPFPASEQDIQHMVNGLAIGKAFGVDEIHPLFLKQGGHLVAKSLHLLFSACWSQGIFPRAWKLAKICPISKLPKPSCDPKKYRPIALLSIVGKLFEKVLVDPLRRHLLSNGHISPIQSGFQPARNCEEQVIRIVEDILFQFETRGACTAVFLDISKAYDSVWRAGLQVKLHRAGVRGNLFALLQSFLGSRCACVEVDRIRSRWESFDWGVPQGARLSPLLFILFINDLAIRLQQFDLLEIAFFADDIAIWTKPCARELHGAACRQPRGVAGS